MLAKSGNVLWSVVMETPGAVSANLVIPFFLIIKGSLLAALLSLSLVLPKEINCCDYPLCKSLKMKKVGQDFLSSF